MRQPSAGKPGLLVPVKALGESKSRLANILSEKDRKRLTRALVEDRVADLVDLTDRVIPAFVTPDQEVMEVVEESGLTVLEEPDSAATLGELVDRAAAGSWFDSSRGLLVLPLDLPWLDADSIQDLLRRCRKQEVLLIPDERNRGTNALWRRPADRFDCQYAGTSSFRAHLAQARKSNAVARVLFDRRFAFDLDVPRDWERLLREPARLSPRMQAFVAGYFAGLADAVGGQ